MRKYFRVIRDCILEQTQRQRHFRLVTDVLHCDRVDDGPGNGRQEVEDEPRLEVMLRYLPVPVDDL